MIKKEKQRVTVENEKLKEAKSAYNNVINKIIEEPLIENTRPSPDFKLSSIYSLNHRA